MNSRCAIVYKYKSACFRNKRPEKQQTDYKLKVQNRELEIQSVSPTELHLLAREHWRRPVELLRVDATALLLDRLIMLGIHRVREHLVMFALVLLEHVECHARMQHIC